MLLKSLELQGFKSFPEKTVLTFNSGITAVVGPNGSGKSNISDAIRWVLGEQAIKSIRCSKMEDIIFNGTTERKAKGFASVTLTISNEDRKLPVDDDEIAITRRFYRSGESEYLINKKDVRLKDIHELFMDTGLGKDGYSVISQGKIDDIVASKSEDRREIFEEASGISKYRYRKLQAQKRLEQTEENLLRLYDIFKELEERIEPLKEQSIKAKSYVEFANRKKSIEIGTWLFTLSKANDVLKNYENKIAVSQEQYDGIEKRLEEYNSKLENFSQSIINCTIRVDDTRRKISNCDENVIKKNGEISVLENDILHNDESIRRLLQNIAELEKSLPDIENSLMRKNEELDILKEKFKQKSLELKNNEENLKSLTEQINKSIDNSENLSDELTKLNEMSSGLNLQIITSKSSLESLKERQLDLNQKISFYNEKIDFINEELLLKKDNLDKLNLNLENSSVELKNADVNIENIEKECESLKVKADNLTMDADTHVRKIRLLEELERNLDGFAQSVKFIMKESKKNLLAGIHGPVSRLIKVPNNFFIAIETALGAAMQNIIVDTEKSAEEAISLLKKNKIGRATFLPISSIKGFSLQNKELEFCPGFIGIASQMCDCDVQYKNILDFLLGRIVIADTLDNAVNIAKKFAYKFKIVTLDGQVVNTGGSLTGGAIGKNVGLLSRAEQITLLKKEYEELNGVAKEARNSYAEKQKSLVAYKVNYDELKTIVQKNQVTLNEFEQKYHQKVIERDSLQSVCENFVKEKIDVEVKIKQITENLINFEKKFNEVLKNEEVVKKSLFVAGTSKSEVIAQRELVNTKFQELRLDVFSLNKEIEIISAEINSILENKKLTENQRVNLAVEVDDLKNKSLDIKNQISDITKEIENLKNLSLELANDINVFNLEKIEFEKEITKLRNSERSTLNEKEKVALEIARLEDKKINIQKEYDEIIAKLWDEYELTRREALAQFEVIENNSKVEKELNELRLKIKALGIVNVAAIEEYNQVSERYEFMKAQINDVEKSKKELYRLINELTIQMRTLFCEKFKQINENFNIVFKELFGGGKANLDLSDPSDVLNCGIEIYVQPPGKIVTHLEALSGGERALIAIALYFAIMKVNPSPFCILDEIEAALDDVNVVRFADYLRKMNKNTQFIVISHRRGTMEEADVLYGVTMQNEGVSKLLELRATEIEKTFVS